MKFGASWAFSPTRTTRNFFSGATFARWAAQGAHITFVLATSGDKGSADPQMTPERLALMREEEECNAAKALGVQEVIFLRFSDGELYPTLELRRAVTRLIRMKQPETVVSCDPTMFFFGNFGINHPDHRAIGTAVIDSVYPTARDRLNFIELERDEGLPTHKVKYLYLSGTEAPNVRVDVTDYVETKINALREHKSQIADMDAMAERVRMRLVDSQSPPESPRYIESFRLITLG